MSKAKMTKQCPHCKAPAGIPHNETCQSFDFALEDCEVDSQQADAAEFAARTIRVEKAWEAEMTKQCPFCMAPPGCPHVESCRLRNVNSSYHKHWPELFDAHGNVIPKAAKLPDVEHEVSCKILWIGQRDLVDILTGVVHVANFPNDVRAEAMCYDFQRDAIGLRIASREFPLQSDDAELRSFEAVFERVPRQQLNVHRDILGIMQRIENTNYSGDHASKQTNDSITMDDETLQLTDEEQQRLLKNGFVISPEIAMFLERHCGKSAGDSQCTCKSLLNGHEVGCPLHG